MVLPSTHYHAKYRRMFPPGTRGWKRCKLCREPFNQKPGARKFRWLFCSRKCSQDWQSIYAKVYVPCKVCDRPLTKRQRDSRRTHCSVECWRVTAARQRAGRQLVIAAKEFHKRCIAKWAPELAAYHDAHLTAGQGNIYVDFSDGLSMLIPEGLHNVKRTWTAFDWKTGERKVPLTVRTKSDAESGVSTIVDICENDDPRNVE
jgi:hypothetical protein